MNTSELTLLDRMEQLEARCARMESQIGQAQRRLRIQASLAFCALVGAVLISPAGRQAMADSRDAITCRIEALEQKTMFLSADRVAKSTTFSGCNVYINDGGGTTSTIVTNHAGQGLGNLIIGYNETRFAYNGSPDVRTGSHNLIVGAYNSYSSFGGLLAGTFDTLSGSYACITGGQGNTASGTFASVSGGQENVASNTFASISGGGGNSASGVGSSVSGGIFDTASSDYSSASGGVYNTANAIDSSVSGGYAVTQSTEYGWSGGSLHSP
jgi:hypothetical protein